MDKRTDRWNDVQEFIKKNPGLNISRFSAISPTKQQALDHLHSSLHSTAFDGWPRYTSDEIKGLGAVGCFLSHRELWKQFLRSDSKIALILEDDLDCKDSSALSEIVYNYLKDTEWDFVLLGWVGTLVDPRKHFTGTHAYMLTKPMAHRLLSFAYPIKQQVDFFMNAVIKASPDMRIKISNTRLRQRNSSSDILTWVWLDILAVLWVLVCVFLIVYYYQ